MMRRTIGTALALTVFAIAGCESGDQNELRDWMKTETKDLRGRIPPLPQVKPYEPVAYDAAGLVDPFRSSRLMIENKQQGGGGLQPDMNRPKEPLEAFPLESLKYVGYLSKSRQPHAIILADAALHQVKIGNYMGQNFGVVTRISDSDIVLRELVQDSAGDWVERTSTLMLQAKEGK